MILIIWWCKLHDQYKLYIYQLYNDTNSIIRIIMALIMIILLKIALIILIQIIILCLKKKCIQASVNKWVLRNITFI